LFHGHKIQTNTTTASSRAFEPVTVKRDAFQDVAAIKNDSSIIALANRYGTLVTPTEVAFEHGELADYWQWMRDDLQHAMVSLDPKRDLTALCAKINEQITLKDVDPEIVQLALRGRGVPFGVAPLQAVLIDGRICRRVVAPNLRTMLWLQFLAVAEGFTDLRHCAAPNCKRVLLVGGGAFRTNRGTCSEACKVALNVHLHTMAVRLHRQGLGLRAIMKRLKVEGWRPGKYSGRSPEQQIKQWLLKE
jgi:hypothetical protein